MNSRQQPIEKSSSGPDAAGAINQRIFETSLDLILVMDSHGNFIRISPSCASILGYDPEELIGRSAADFIHTADLESTRAEMRLARSGRLTRNFESRYLHKEGRLVTLRWMGVWSEPEEQHFFIGRDVTEQKLAEDKFRLAVEASPSGMVMIDSSGAIVLVNAETERLFGYGRAELIGQPIDILVPAQLRGRHLLHRRDFISQPVARRMGAGRDLYGVRKDGTEFPVEIGLNPIQTQSDLLVLSVIVDITERKLAEKRVQNLQSELLHLSRLTTMGQMASSLAHELNQPLAAISNYVEGCRLLLEKDAPADQSMLRDTMALVSEQALRASNIIRRLREFVSRGETARKVENLSILIEEAATLALIGAKEAGIRCEFAFHSKNALVLADRTQIQQVCMNLMRNAVEAMRDCERRVLTISTKPADAHTIAISIADTGIGIADEVAVQLFKPFVTTKSEGMGVGLSICRGIVEAHGGRINVEPNTGGGMIFCFTLPSVKETESSNAV
jgi:two-component system sensor kinase FixL